MSQKLSEKEKKYRPKTKARFTQYGPGYGGNKIYEGNDHPCAKLGVIEGTQLHMQNTAHQVISYSRLYI